MKFTLPRYAYNTAEVASLGWPASEWGGEQICAATVHSTGDGRLYAAQHSREVGRETPGLASGCVPVSLLKWSPSRLCITDGGLS